MTESLFIDLFKLGLKPIPLKWDVATKSADSHWIAHSEITDDNYNEVTFKDWVKNITEANGIALKLFPPFGTLDFDLKNTEDKTVFDVWLRAVQSQDDDILSKICIERTRNKGYHVYIKYSKLTSKTELAREVNGDEVIAIYTGGVLSYCDPTPGYEMFHNEFTDLEELTDDQFDILISCAHSFDKYIPVNKTHSQVIFSYPIEYENICLQFDKNITDDLFVHIINSIGLIPAPHFKNKKTDKFVAYLRKGSQAKYSAKVYFGTYNLQLFTSSMPGFPSFNDRANKDDTSWNLSPSRIVFYKNDRDWIATIDEIRLLAESADIELIEQQPITKQPLLQTDRLKFPYDIFPDSINNFISCQHIQHEYLAGFILGAASALIGNSAKLKANGNYIVKPIIYLVVVAPPGSSKTPALKTVFSFIEDLDNFYYQQYTKEKIKYKAELAEYKNQKKGDGIQEPHAPIMKQVLIKDSTIEMVIKILSFNKPGCTILADELSGFLNRMNRYNDGDEVQKWLELWSGSPVLMQRVSRDEDKVMEPYCSIIGGIQPGVLDNLSSSENQHNGFYHRFLFVYPEPQKKPDWTYFEMPDKVRDDFRDTFQLILNSREGERNFTMTDEATAMYAEWFNYKNTKYNSAVTDNVKGIIAKYQDYCLRFALIIQIINDGNSYNTYVNHLSVERAIRLTEYFLGNMNKSLKILAPVTPIDKLNGVQQDFYKALPQSFSAATAVKIGEGLNIKSDYCRMIIRRWSEPKDQLLTKSGNQKNASYDKIY